MSKSEFKYTEDHEWVSVTHNVATIGISTYAAEELGEVVFCELPEVGTLVSQADECGSVESVKTVSSIYSPLSGEILEINTEIEDNPAIINESPMEDGWLYKLDIADLKEVDDLMTEEEYQQFLDSNGDEAEDEDED